MSDNQHHNAEGLDTLHKLIKQFRTAMLVTVTHEGHLHSRPMALQEVDDIKSGTMFFMTNIGSAKADDLDRDHACNLSFGSDASNTWVSVSGKARVYQDKAKSDELWEPIHKVWFPEGKDDPTLAILRFDISGAEYWDGSSSKMVQIFQMARAVVTGNAYKDGDHGTIEVGK